MLLAITKFSLCWGELKANIKNHLRGQMQSADARTGKK